VGGLSALAFKLQPVTMADDDEVCVDEVVAPDERHERLEHPRAECR
jgi:hypothetical protein